MPEEFPQEYYLTLDGEDYFLGRLTLNQHKDGKTSALIFHVEVDIVQKESKKIWKHVDILYNFHESQEAIDAGVQRLSRFLSRM